MQPDDETKHKMMDILKRFHSEEETESMDEDEDTTLSEGTIQKILSGKDYSLDDLSAEEMKQFRRAMASGELSKLIEPWEPWWLKPSARRISLGSEGTQLVQPIEQDTTMQLQDGMQSSQLSEIPAGPDTPLQPVSKLTSTPPSALLPVHLIDIMYSYCFTLRLYNGEWQSDPLGAATVLLNVSYVLGESGQPESVSEALAHCLEQTCSAAYKHAGGLRFGLGLFDDIVCLLHLGGAALVCFLCDLHRLIQAAEGDIGSEKPRKLKSEMKRKLKLANKKVYFLTCWVHEQPEEAWPSLATVVDVEKKVVAATAQGEIRKPGKANFKESKSQVLIEEVQ